jgi:hypothetical protein
MSLSTQLGPRMRDFEGWLSDKKTQAAVTMHHVVRPACGIG